MVKFQSGTRRRALEYEKDIVNYWKENNTFEKSIALRPKENSYVFYDGPPFITGVPHHGTLLSSVVKDAIPRYHTMKGKRVERVWGWDCHGLPAENFVEKKLGIKDRHEIGTTISLADSLRQRAKAWCKPLTYGSTPLIALAVGSTLRVPIKPWTKRTWKVSGGPLSSCMKRAKFMKAKKF